MLSSFVLDSLHLVQISFWIRLSYYSMVAPQSLNSFFSFLTSRMYTLNAHCYFLNHRPWALTMYSAPVTINICSSCLRNFICLQYPKFSIAAVLIIYTLLFPELFLEQGFSSLEDSLWLGSATHKKTPVVSWADSFEIPTKKRLRFHSRQLPTALDKSCHSCRLSTNDHPVPIRGRVMGMETLIGLVNRIQRACTALGDYGGDSVQSLWESLPSVVVVGGQVCGHDYRYPPQTCFRINFACFVFVAGDTVLDLIYCTFQIKTGAAPN